jgi:sigma-B regulation protein RsbU (phosphoserine phosphatase)
VIEAQNSKGELFGFERKREMHILPAIVEAAKQFGQQDDITVITIERLATTETNASQTASILIPA